jgi:hypothetical protein
VPIGIHVPIIPTGRAPGSILGLTGVRSTLGAGVGVAVGDGVAAGVAVGPAVVEGAAVAAARASFEAPLVVVGKAVDVQAPIAAAARTAEKARRWEGRRVAGMEDLLES